MIEYQRFVLITPQGEQMKFYIEDLAKMYQSIHGGVLLDVDTQAPRSAIIPFKPLQKKTG